MKAEEYIEIWMQEAMAFMIEKEIFAEFCLRFEARCSLGKAIEK